MAITDRKSWLGTKIIRAAQYLLPGQQQAEWPFFIYSCDLSFQDISVYSTTRFTYSILFFTITTSILSSHRSVIEENKTKNSLFNMKRGSVWRSLIEMELNTFNSRYFLWKSPAFQGWGCSSIGECFIPNPHKLALGWWRQELVKGLCYKASSRPAWDHKVSKTKKF